MIGAGLGRNYFSILEDNMFEAKKDSVTTIKVGDIEPRRDQPRKQFDDEALQMLADSISIHGVLQPIIVRENKNFPDIGEKIVSIECNPFVPQIRYVNPEENTVGYFITVRLRYVNRAQRKTVEYECED